MGCELAFRTALDWATGATARESFRSPSGPAQSSGDEIDTRESAPHSYSCVR